MCSGKVLLGVFVGVTVGAVLGILYAPEKGKVTRRKISKKGVDYVDSLKDKFDGVLDDINEKFEEFKEEVTQLTHQSEANAVTNKNGKTFINL